MIHNPPLCKQNANVSHSPHENQILQPNKLCRRSKAFVAGWLVTHFNGRHKTAQMLFGTFVPSHHLAFVVFDRNNSMAISEHENILKQAAAWPSVCHSNRRAQHDQWCFQHVLGGFLADSRQHQWWDELRDIWRQSCSCHSGDVINERSSSRKKRPCASGKCAYENKNLTLYETRSFDFNRLN